MNNFFYTYLLCSHKDKKYYSGYTVNLGNRLKEHKSGKVLSTKYRLPVDLIYFEGCLNEEDAKRREKYLKSGKGKKYIKKRLSRFLLKKCSGWGPLTGTP